MVMSDMVKSAVIAVHIVSFCIKCGWKIALITVGAAVSLIFNSPIDNVNRELGWEDQKNEMNISKMTKKGQKMSFHARKVEIMANIGIMEIVIERHREAEPLIFTGDEAIWDIDLDITNLMEKGDYYEKEHFKKDVCVVCAYVCWYSVDWLLWYSSGTFGEYTGRKQHRGDAGECRRGGIWNKSYQ